MHGLHRLLFLLLLAGCAKDQEESPARTLEVDPACEPYGLEFGSPDTGGFCATVICPCDAGDDVALSVATAGQCLVALECEAACADQLGVRDVLDCVR